MDVRIGVTYTAKEIEVEMADDTDRAELIASVDGAIGGTTTVLWLTDRRGRTVGIPAEKIAYIELGRAVSDRRVGFGA